MTESYPLKWPVGRPRTDKWRRKAAAFKTTPGRARDELMRELKLLGASNVVISANVTTYRRGGQDIMYADQSAAKEDPGVAVYYSWKGDQYALACDRWNTVMDNLQALNKTVDAIRGIERWGTGEMMKAAFSGFKALPLSSDSGKKKWWDVLDVPQFASQDKVTSRYMELRKKLHPDAGGTHEAFIELKAAYDLALQSFLINR